MAASSGIASGKSPREWLALASRCLKAIVTDGYGWLGLFRRPTVAGGNHRRRSRCLSTRQRTKSRRDRRNMPDTKPTRRTSRRTHRPARLLTLVLALLALQLASLVAPAYACGCGAMVTDERRRARPPG